MVIKQIHTPKGIFKRKLSQQEVEERAKMGDQECKKELVRQKIREAKTIKGIKELIHQLLEVT